MIKNRKNFLKLRRLIDLFDAIFKNHLDLLRMLRVRRFQVIDLGYLVDIDINHGSMLSPHLHCRWDLASQNAIAI